MTHSLPKRYRKSNANSFRSKKFFRKGDAGFVVLLGVVLVAFILGGGIATFYNANYGTQGNLLTPIPQYGAHNTNQLHTLNFMTITPSPSPVPPSPSSIVTQGPSNSGGFASCGYTVPSDESGEILYGFSPGPGGSVGPGGKVELWYNDEHALTLGSGIGVSPNSSSPQHVVNPNTGDPAGKDNNGLYWRPGLYLTDITGGASNIGDAEKGGIPNNPSEVYGTWKTALNTNDPTKNFYNLGPGADPFPKTGNHGTGADDIWYGSLVIWNVNNLTIGGQPLQAGHIYRAEFIIHDGDSDKGGSDLGIGCATIKA